MPYELAKLTGCTRISKSISHREDMCHQMLPAFCAVFIPSCDCCSWRAYFFTPFFFFAPFFFLSPWSPGPLVPWSSGPVVLWSRGPLVPWSLGLLGPLVRCSPLVPWSSQVYKVTSIPCEAANLDVRYYWW